MERIIYILERIFRISHVPVRYLDKTGKITLFCRGYDPKDDPLLCDVSLCQSIINKPNSDSIPCLEFEEEFVYGILKDSALCNVIWGPLGLSKIDSEQLRHYACRHNLADRQIKIRHGTLDELCAALSIFHFAITGKYITEMDIITNKEDSANTVGNHVQQAFVQAYELDRAEQERSRYNYSDEAAFLRHIREGNPEGVAKCAEIALPSFEEIRVGKLAKRSFKQNEYMAITSITLASRAAIDGGLDPLSAYLTSDLYFQRLEECREITQIYRLIQEVAIDYANRVKQKKEERSQLSYIEKCKNFIAGHLNKHFTVDEIAAEIGINSSYLSRRFSESEGIGIQQYTQTKRVEAAANMLKFSGESIFAISNYLCFASQSYFGKVFREHMGLTPQKYREKNKLIDFDA